MSIKDTLTNNSMNSFSFGGKTYTRRVDNGAVVYDISAGTDGSAFSTGWVNTDGTTAVANGATLTFDHNLGTTDFVTQIWVSHNAEGTNAYQIFTDSAASAQGSKMDGAAIDNISENQLTLQLGAGGFFNVSSSGTWSKESWASKYIKVVASAKMGSGGGGGGGGGGASVTTDETAPTNPSDGDLWYDEDGAALYVYTDSIGGWIQANGGGGGGTGPRAYVEFDGTASNMTNELSASNSFNVSSITDHQAGQYTVTFTSPVPNPVAVHDNGERSDGYPILYSDLYNVGSNSIKIGLGSNNLWYDSAYISLIVF